MRIFIIVILIVYLAAVNVYGVLLVKHGRDEEEADEECCKKTGKYVLAGALGGAPGIYISMFIFKFRTQSLLMMAMMPVFTCVTAFLIFALFSNNFFLPVAEEVASTFAKGF